MLSFAILLLIASAEPTVVTSGQEQSRQAVRKLDNCLMESAERLRNAQSAWAEKYQSYFASCAEERRVAIHEALRAQWTILQPRTRDERRRAYRRATIAVEDRFDIWASRFLDPGPTLH